jgi:hypothetical protein
VGTASVAATVDGRRDLVLAALLHAAYTDGDFGDGRGASDEDARSRVRSAVGRDAEALVVAYGQTPWNAAALASAHAEHDELDATRRDVVILRIANEADEHADLGVRVCDKGGLDLYREESLAMMCELAHRIDRPALAALLRSLTAEEHDQTVPVVLQSSGRASHFMPPASYRLRDRLLLRRSMDRARAAVSRLCARTARRTR